MLSRLALLLSLWTTLATLTSANPIQRRQFETYPAPNVVPAPQQSWIDTYNIALVAGRIPTLPPAVGAAGVVNYVGIQPNCSWTISKCYADDIHATTSGIVALGFDDVSLPSKFSRLLEILCRIRRDPHQLRRRYILSFARRTFALRTSLSVVTSCIIPTFLIERLGVVRILGRIRGVIDRASPSLPLSIVSDLLGSD